MKKKDIIVIWDKEIIDGKSRTLPNSNLLYTQIYDTSGSWSIIIEFIDSPLKQGYFSVGKAKFMMKEAPHEILRDGFKFYFYDGKVIIGECEIIE